MSLNNQPSDPTFRGYSPAQGAQYAQHRRNYNPKLYESILNFHKLGSGQLDTLVDIGCGPGTATRSLAPNFKRAYGLDPSEGMISTARSISEDLNAAENIKFEVSTGEALAATCAHWFDMPRFWVQAAKILKPGGTVALWTSASVRVDPSMPNHEAIQTAIDEIDVMVKDYMVQGNLLVRDLYRDLALPWQIEPSVSVFDPDSFVRKEWCTGPDAETMFFEHQPPISLDMMEMILGTASPVTRWREAHPEAVGTENDVVRQVRRKIEKAFTEAGVEKGKEILKGDMTGVLLLFRKKSDPGT